jgi:hypothetical protein
MTPRLARTLALDAAQAGLLVSSLGAGYIAAVALAGATMGRAERASAEA